MRCRMRLSAELVLPGAGDFYAAVTAVTYPIYTSLPLLLRLGNRPTDLRRATASHERPGSLNMPTRLLGRFQPDGFVLALVGTVALATLLPCQGTSAVIFHTLGSLAVASLFFLQGARLSRSVLVAGAEHWRLHAVITSATFVLFPLLGLGLWMAAPHALPRALWSGVLFVCVLPSTVQSSVALTSIARGNVAAAVCSATASNIAGLVVSPMMLALLLHLHGGSIALDGLWKILLQLLVPFTAGHLLRP